MNNYSPIIGLEIHVQLKTKSGMFCGCKNDPFHAEKPNMYTCPVCLGLPGALPVPNKKAIEWTIMLGLALGCEIPLESKFDRKNYFYPDLPKGYQISQYDKPLARNGELKLKAQSSKLKVEEEKTVRIRRVHLEEDTGKLIHATVDGRKVSLVDFNRSGVPLVEIVTEPDMESADEAYIFLKKLHQIIRYLDISEASMETGSMRIEPNISVRKIPMSKSQFPIKPEIPASPAGGRNSKPETHSTSLGQANAKSKIQNLKLPEYKVEVKNINSFRFVKKAIEYETARHIELLDVGETPVQETRGWDEDKGITFSQRVKEEAHDYRYFPDPDIPPMRWEESTINNLQLKIPELPDAKVERFMKDYNLSLELAFRVTETRELADYFEESIKQLTTYNLQLTTKDLANWLLNKKPNIDKVKPEELVKEIAEAKIVIKMDKSELNSIVSTVLKNNEKAVSDYKSGKQGVIMFLVGMVMRELKGKGDAREIRKLLEGVLKK